MATIVHWTPSLAIKNRPQEVEHASSGDEGQVKLYINGTELTTTSGEPPQKGAEIGLIGASGPSSNRSGISRNLR